MEGGTFLPPEPSGPEPDLGRAPRAGEGQRPTQPQQPEQQPTQPQHPPPQQQLGWGAPPQAPGWGEQPQQGWQPPPPGWYPPPAQQPWAYQPRPPAEPDNGPAVAGFVLSVAAGVLLLISGGLSTVISVVCAGLGIFYSRRGRRRVDRGETPKHRGLAQAGFITGIVALVLAVLATIFWAILAVLYATDESFRQDFDDGFNDQQSTSAVRLAALAARVVTSLLT